MTQSMRWVHRCGKTKREIETKTGIEKGLVRKTHMIMVSLSVCLFCISKTIEQVDVYIYMKLWMRKHQVVMWVSVAGGRLNGHSRPERKPDAAGYESSSTLMSSELDTTSFFDSEEDDSASRWVRDVICILPNIWLGSSLILVFVWFSIFFF